jgi:hypothetical protein
MFDTYVFGEDFWGGAVDGDLAVSGVRTDGGVEAVHVDEAVHVEVVAQREVARPRQVHHAEVAARLGVVVHAVGDDAWSQEYSIMPAWSVSSSMSAFPTMKPLKLM